MRDFSIIAPTTKSACLALLAESDKDRRIIAGGTGLVNLMKQHLVSPEELISLHKVTDLRALEMTDSQITIGALTRLADIQSNPDIVELIPVLAETLAEVASPRIRSMATIGGTIAHGDPNQDMPVTLTALGTVVVIEAEGSSREVNLEDFYRDYYETVLEPNEMVTAIRIPLTQPEDILVYKKYTPASMEDYACISVCIRLTIHEDTCRASRIILGAVGPTIIRSYRAEELINGSLSDDHFMHRLDEAATVAAADTDPIADTRGSVEYKRQMVKVWVKRCVLTALGQNP